MHSNLIMISTAALVMGAGVMIGRVLPGLPDHPGAVEMGPGENGPHEPGPPQGRPRSWLNDQLNLTPDQRQKMDAIWAVTRQRIDMEFEGRRQAEQDREKAVMSLLTDQQRAAYEKINKDYRDKRDELFKERAKLIQEANDQSRALLDEDQKIKWDIVTKEMRERRGPPGPGMGPGPERRPPQDMAPTTNPAGGVETSRA